MAVQTVATLEASPQTSVEELWQQLARTPEKAEIVNGKVVVMPPTGDDPNHAGFEIAVSLRQYAKEHRTGRAVTDNAGFKVNLPNRKSFSPDAAFFTGKLAGMGFFEGAPLFAVEVRSENDYGKQAERAIAEKRAEYFAADTQIVWDVDLLSEEVIRAYSANDPDHPRIFRRGEIADAEPVLSGWRMLVDELFN